MTGLGWVVGFGVGGFWGVAVGFSGVGLDTGFLRLGFADKGGGLLGARSPAGGRGSGR